MMRESEFCVMFILSYRLEFVIWCYFIMSLRNVILSYVLKRGELEILVNSINSYNKVLRLRIDLSICL